MCGRTFCALDPACLLQKCRYVQDGKTVCPEWKESCTGELYKPSTNIGPTMFTPVIISSMHLNAQDETSASGRIMQPMRWGLVPSWHKGDRKSFKAMHNNCRGETMMEKNTFAVPFKKGRRCVVVAEGFYEWKTDGKKKTPFAFTPLDQTDVKSLTDMKSEKEQISPLTPAPHTKIERKFDGPDDSRPLLFMAGIFDVCKEEAGSLFSYSIITTDSVGKIAKVHHRMPVILQSPDDIERWLNYKDHPYSSVRHLVAGKDCLKCHQVTDKVNNVRYQEADCCLPLPTTKSSGGYGDLKKWFTDTPQKHKLASSGGLMNENLKRVKTDVKDEKIEKSDS